MIEPHRLAFYLGKPFVVDRFNDHPAKKVLNAKVSLVFVAFSFVFRNLTFTNEFVRVNSCRIRARVRWNDKFERQLLKVGQQKNPNLRLAFALATFHASGEYEPALRDWEAKPKVDQTFVNFCVFIQKEFGKQHKQNKTTAKLVGFGIANSVTDKDVEQIEQLEAQALMIAELANSMQEQNQKQFKEMMELFKATLDKNSPTPKNPKTGTEKKKKKCPHCGLEVYHKPDACYELDANATKRPADWKSKKGT